MKEILIFFCERTERWCCATTLNGFKLWNIEDEQFQNFHLPNGVRNITKKFNQSSNIIISKDDKLAVTGIRSIHIVKINQLLILNPSTGRNCSAGT